MGHYAKVLDGRVVQVIVAKKEFFDSFVDSSPGEWLKCSYNTRGGVHYSPETGLPDGGEAIRFNYPGVGSLYDREHDAFYIESPFPSWVLNKETFIWDPPVPHPEDGREYMWNEKRQSWDSLDEVIG